MSVDETAELSAELSVAWKAGQSVVRMAETLAVLTVGLMVVSLVCLLVEMMGNWMAEQSGHYLAGWTVERWVA